MTVGDFCFTYLRHEASERKAISILHSKRHSQLYWTLYIVKELMEKSIILSAQNTEHTCDYWIMNKQMLFNVYNELRSCFCPGGGWIIFVCIWILNENGIVVQIFVVWPLVTSQYFLFFFFIKVPKYATWKYGKDFPGHTFVKIKQIYNID